MRQGLYSEMLSEQSCHNGKKICRATGKTDVMTSNLCCDALSSNYAPQLSSAIVQTRPSLSYASSSSTAMAGYFRAIANSSHFKVVLFRFLSLHGTSHWNMEHHFELQLPRPFFTELVRDFLILAKRVP